MSNEQHAISAAKMFMENMVAEALLAQRVGLKVDPGEVVNASFSAIGDSLSDTLGLARLMDQSDVLLHAEGPGAAHGMPWIGALNWLLHSAEQNIRRLTAATIDLWGGDGKSLGRKVDLRVPGVVPGSLWIGVKIMAPAGDLVPEDLELIDRLSSQVDVLPAMTRMIEDEGISGGIDEISPDPAIRDVQLRALYSMSPTGRRGIHTIDLRTRAEGRASLSQRERVVLHEAIVKPRLSRALQGEFVGDVREADLDKSRLHLRNVDGVGTLRCIIPELGDRHTAALLGKTVRVTGSYQTDHLGRPRLMLVESIEPHQVQKQLMDD